LDQIAGKHGTAFHIYDSLLSENGVLGFEYGYSLENPKGLTIWEAQFGDFANGAQVIIDQFVASGETKWNRASGLVMLLPHGYEGQGAEHSSARIERFLQLCALDNLQVVQPTTPAQMFHLLRRQVLQTFRKPLIVFTPKSLLRNPVCSSAVDELESGRFRDIRVVGEIAAARLLLICSGRIFYDLVKEVEQRQLLGVVIVTVEQLYPLRLDLLKDTLAGLPATARRIWVQDEPENMGAWYYIRPYLEQVAGVFEYAGREADSCPAVGSHHQHGEQQARIMQQVFG
jgi:2-oxoglutarate dehydrogenase E1 component